MYKIRTMNINQTHNKDFSMDREYGLDCYMILLIKTPARIYADGEIKAVNAKTAIIFSPHKKQYYAPLGDTYINDWMHFEVAKEVIEETNLILNNPFQPINFHQAEKIFSIICSEFYSEGANKNEVLNHLLMSLLYSLAETHSISESVNSSQYHKLIKLRQDIYGEPEKKWTVYTMAQRLNLSKGHFQSIYKNAFSVTCNADVINARLTKAKQLLLETNETAKQISIMCGYENDVHFMRQFKKVFSLTPSEYRKIQKNPSKV